jgi:hypothetical protein
MQYRNSPETAQAFRGVFGCSHLFKSSTLVVVPILNSAEGYLLTTIYRCAIVLAERNISQLSFDLGVEAHGIHWKFNDKRTNRIEIERSDQ